MPLWNEVLTPVCNFLAVVVKAKNRRKQDCVCVHFHPALQQRTTKLEPSRIRNHLYLVRNFKGRCVCTRVEAVTRLLGTCVIADYRAGNTISAFKSLRLSREYIYIYMCKCSKPSSIADAESKAMTDKFEN